MMITASKRQDFAIGNIPVVVRRGQYRLCSLTEFAARDAIVENERDLLLRNLHARCYRWSSWTTTSPAIRWNCRHRLLRHRRTFGRLPRAPGRRTGGGHLPQHRPNGYSGRIHMLVGVYVDGSLAGVRVVKHAETPGLGDGIEIRKSPWITGFDGKSLADPGPPKAGR